MATLSPKELQEKRRLMKQFRAPEALRDEQRRHHRYLTEDEFPADIIRADGAASRDMTEEAHMLREAMAALVIQLHVVHRNARYRRVWECAQNIDGAYDGPD